MRYIEVFFSFLKSITPFLIVAAVLVIVAGVLITIHQKKKEAGKKPDEEAGKKKSDWWMTKAWPLIKDNRWVPTLLIGYFVLRILFANVLPETWWVAVKESQAFKILPYIVLIVAVFSTLGGGVGKWVGIIASLTLLGVLIKDTKRHWENIPIGTFSLSNGQTFRDGDGPTVIARPGEWTEVITVPYGYKTRWRCDDESAVFSARNEKGEVFEFSKTNWPKITGSSAQFTALKPVPIKIKFIKVE